MSSRLFNVYLHLAEGIAFEPVFAAQINMRLYAKPWLHEDSDEPGYMPFRTITTQPNMTYE
jgi:hypothetical protein